MALTPRRRGRSRMRGVFRRVPDSMFIGSAADAAVPSALTSTLANSSFAGASGTLTFTCRDVAGVALPGQSVTFAVNAEALISAALSTVSASTNTIANDGVERCTLTHAIKDTAGDPVVGFPAASCVLAVTPTTGNTTTQPASASTVAGVVSGSFVSTNAETKSASFTDASLAITQTQSVVVSGTASTIEPGGSDVINLDQNFNGYATRAALLAQLATLQAGASGWWFFCGPPTGSEREYTDTMVAGGYGGSSHAYRITVDFGAVLEATMNATLYEDSGQSWAYHPNGTTLFTEFWVRTSLTNMNWIKGMELYQNVDRTQCGWYNTGGSLGPFNIHPQSNNREIYLPCETGQADFPGATGRLATVNDNAWHRLTFMYKASSSAGATDGINRMYVDGALWIDASLAGYNANWMMDRQYGVSSSSTAPYPGNVGDKYSNVTGLQALQGLSDDPILNIVFPGIFRGNSASGGGTFDIGRVRLWYRT